MGIIHWFDLVGLLVEIAEQSVVFAILLNDWNESESNGVWKEEQDTCCYSNQKQSDMLPMEVFHISIIEPDLHDTTGKVNCGIC